MNNFYWKSTDKNSYVVVVVVVGALNIRIKQNYTIYHKY